MNEIERKKVLVIQYTNHRGETSVRRILPLAIYFAATQWHPDEQWILDAHDTDKDVIRSFALRDVVFLNRL